METKLSFESYEISLLTLLFIKSYYWFGDSSFFNRQLLTIKSNCKSFLSWQNDLLIGDSVIIIMYILEVAQNTLVSFLADRSFWRNLSVVFLSNKLRWLVWTEIPQWFVLMTYSAYENMAWVVNSSVAAYVAVFFVLLKILPSLLTVSLVILTDSLHFSWQVIFYRRVLC